MNLPLQTIPLPLLSTELGISDGEELEEFIIEAIQVNAISVSTVSHRELTGLQDYGRSRIN